MLFRPMSLYDHQERLLHTPSNQCGTTHVGFRVQLRRVFCVCGRQKENSYTSFMMLFDGNQFGQCAAPPPRSSHNAYDAFVRLCLLELNGPCAIRWSAMAFRGNGGEPCHARARNQTFLTCLRGCCGQTQVTLRNVLAVCFKK
jgi:hypothetical protein